MEKVNKRMWAIDISLVITIATCLSIAFYRFVYNGLLISFPNLGILSLFFWGIIIVLCMYVYHYFFLKNQKEKEQTLTQNQLIEDTKKYFEDCKQCVVDKVDNESFLAYYNLVTFNELLRIEGTLEKGDEIIVYTSHLDTEDDAEQVVRSNIEKGVIYNVLYFEGTKEKENSLKKAGYKNVFPVKKDINNFDYQLTNKETGSETGFDLMFYKKQNKTIEAYFCINFSKGVCNKSKVSKCSGPCLKSISEDEREKYLFYKKIDDALANSLFVTLHNIIVKKNESK